MIFLSFDPKPLIVVAVSLIIIFSLGIKVVPKNKVYIVERLGIYHRTLKRGIYFIFIGSERIRAKISLEDQEEFFPFTVYSKDFSNIKGEAKITYVIKHPNNFAYRSNIIMEDLRFFVFEYLQKNLETHTDLHSLAQSLLSLIKKEENLADLSVTKIEISIK